MLHLFPIPSFHGELISNNKVTVSNPKKIMIHIRISASLKLLFFFSLLCEAITMVCAWNGHEYLCKSFSVMQINNSLLEKIWSQ